MTRHRWYLVPSARPTVYQISEPPADGTPVAVIDPENREQVERLLRLMLRLRCRCGRLLVEPAPSCTWHEARAQKAASLRAKSGSFEDSDLAAALREFADPTPPKPDEPTGLGAVVEDAEGKRWVRWSARDDLAAWCPPDPNVARSSWHHVDAVRVLSEGVRP